MKGTLCACLCLLLLLAAVPAMAAQGPTAGDLATYNQEVAALSGEIDGMLEANATRLRTGSTLQIFKHFFNVEGKGDSLTQALNRAKATLMVKIQENLNSIADRDYVLLNSPKWMKKLEHNWRVEGISLTCTFSSISWFGAGSPTARARPNRRRGATASDGRRPDMT